MKVLKETWNPDTDHFFLVERIEIRKWPYGFAWGRYHRDGKSDAQQKISAAGTYQWKRVQ